VNPKRIDRRPGAIRDIDATIDYYLQEAGDDVALGFIDALERAFSQIARHPAAGSPRYARELDLPGLRSWPLRRYPYLIFFIEQEDCIEIWRVLHAERDLPAHMRDVPGG
jgi:toxin ParE1/3/4